MLRPRVHLYLADGSVLRATGSPADYAKKFRHDSLKMNGTWLIVTTTNNLDRHRLDVASAQLAVRKPADAVETLLTVRQSSPEWLRRQGYARDLIRQLVEGRRRAYVDQVGLLADHVGVPL